MAKEAGNLDWNELINQALEAPGHLSDSFNRFYSYSWLNCLLLHMQGVREPVATYDRWRSIGRQVQKGSKAAEIVRPITITKKNDDGEVEARFTRFKPVKCLFTYSQTAGDALPPAEIPEWNLERALYKLDIKREPFSSLDGNTQGYSHGRSIAINPVATDPLLTTIHEVAHVQAGHTSPESVAEYRTHRGRMEFEAEATAYLVGHELEQISESQASESRAYLQSWLQNERPSDASIRKVFATTDQILRAGRVAVEGGEETTV